MPRPTLFPLFLALLWGALQPAGPAVAQGGAASPDPSSVYEAAPAGGGRRALDALPPNRIVVYDSSGSMWNKVVDGNQRYLLTQAFLAELVARARREPAPVTLGMVSLGRLHDQNLGICEPDVSVDVPPGGMVGTDTGDRMLRTATAAKPLGRTPLYEALLRAAEQVPLEQSSTLIVLTDLDDEICGLPPCDLIAELARRGRPYPEKTHIAFLVMIGVDPSKSPIVRKLVACLPGVTVVPVFTLQEATERGRQVAEELATRTAAGPPPPSRQLVPLELRLTFPPGTVLFGDDLRRAGLKLHHASRAGKKAEDVTGDSVTFPTAPGPLHLVLEQGGQTVAGWDETIAAGNTPLTETLLPARVTVEADGIPADASFEWTVTELTTGKGLVKTGGPELLVAPGRYRVKVTVAGQQAEEEFSLSFDEARVLHLLAAEPARGILEVRAEVQRNLLPDGQNSAGTAEMIQIAGPVSPPATRGREATLRALPPGLYSATAQVAGLAVSARQVTVEPGRTTGLRLLFGLARLRLGLRSQATDVVWRLTRNGTARTYEWSGNVLDVTLPPSHYRVQVRAQEGDAEIEDLDLHDYVRQTLTLRPAPN